MVLFDKISSRVTAETHIKCTAMGQSTFLINIPSRPRIDSSMAGYLRRLLTLIGCRALSCHEGWRRFVLRFLVLPFARLCFLHCRLCNDEVYFN